LVNGQNIRHRISKQVRRDKIGPNFTINVRLEMGLCKGEIC
jgi:hypothetical protein